MRRKPRTAGRLIASVAAVVAVGLAFGFLAFTGRVTGAVPQTGQRADAIVVLTGGGARLAEAGRLLRAGRGARLLITGVHRSVTREDLERLTGLSARTFGCCVDLDYAARDTIGNADETRAWARRHAFRSLIVVTASYHMPRSLAELAHVLPDVALQPHAVVPRELAEAGWWRQPGSLRVLAGEYVKYLTSSARRAVARAFGGGAPALAGGSPAARASVAATP